MTKDAKKTFNNCNFRSPDISLSAEVYILLTNLFKFFIITTLFAVFRHLSSSFADFRRLLGFWTDLGREWSKAHMWYWTKSTQTFLTHDILGTGPYRKYKYIITKADLKLVFVNCNFVTLTISEITTNNEEYLCIEAKFVSGYALVSR